MIKVIRIVLGLAVVIGILAGFYHQHLNIESLNTENATLREQLEQSENAHNGNAASTAQEADSSELQRLRAEHAELLRLRAEVTRLQGLLKDASAKRGAGPQETLAVAPTNPPPPLIETYAAAIRTTLNWKQSVVTGGWTLPSGKRGLVFVQPELLGPENGPAAGQVLLRTQILEVPDEMLKPSGLQELKSDNRETISQVILSAEQTEALIQTFSKTPGVEFLSTPKALTADGRQTQVKITELKKLPSGDTYEVGPTVDIMPQISRDRASVDLAITAQMRIPAKPPQ